MEFSIYKIGKTAKEYKPLEEKFVTFILPHRLKVNCLSASKKQDVKDKQIQETSGLISQINSHIPTIILSEHGHSYSSSEFASYLSQKMDSSGKIQFIIGGAYGYDYSTLPANVPKISLGKMTFPHDLAYIVLLEQIYRSITINKGKNYHY